MKSQNNNETIGDKIKQLRNKQGLTQDELARKSDLPYTTLTKIESNVITKPSIQVMHVNPLLENEIKHNASNVRYGHRWCNVTMTDHSLVS